MITTLKRYSNLLLLLILVISVLAVYGYYSHIAVQGFTTDLFAKLGKAFQAGQTYLLTQPPDELLALADPYDSSVNERYIWQDISYFNHKFYVYFGATPALVLWLPIHILTGLHVSDGTLSGICAAIGTTALITLLYLIARKQEIFHRIGFTLVALSVAFGTWIPFLLREPMFYETAIASAYCFSALGALFVWIFLAHSKKYRWLILASLCLGLAVGSRVTHLANGALLAGALFYIAFSTRDTKEVLKTMASFLPYILCLIAIGIYNYVRFGNPFDIGWRYVLTILGNLHSPEFNPVRPDMFFVNVYLYLFKPLLFSGSLEFPFYHKPIPTVPWNHPLPWYQEMIFGFWVNSPFALFYPLFLCNILNTKKWLPQTRILIYSLLVYNLVIFSFLLVYYFPTERYLVDFAPWMMAIGGIYYLHLLKTLPHRRSILLWTGGILAAYSIFTGLIVGYCSYGFWPKLPT